MAMRYYKILLLIPFLVFAACKSSKTITETPPHAVAGEGPSLLTFNNGITVSKGEFERVYQKNNGGYEKVKTHTPEQLREYLDLYVNFKRKVFAAEAQELHETTAFKQEFETYRKQLAQPYLSAKEVEEQIIKEAYDRSKFLVNADHLLVTVAEDASPADTLAAYQKTLAYRDSIVSGGQAFGDMAEKYSQDPSAKQNRGNLGYFSVFDMVYPFESAAFETQIGKVSQPVRTQFGYHLIHVNDKISTAGKKRAAHIIVRIGDRYSAKDTAQAESKIQEIYEMLKKGDDFAELARKHSDDPNSAVNGGDLGNNRLLPEMESLKMKLGAGEFSEPFATRFGWHILKVTEIDSIPDFETAMPGLKQRVSRDARSQVSKTALLSRIKKENNYTFYQENFDAFKATLDQNFPRGTWEADTSRQNIYDQLLFTLNGDYKATIQDLIDYYTGAKPRNFRLTADQAAEAVKKTFVEKELMEYEEERLPEKNPEFRYLVQEYRDGILLFTLMEQKVWKKAVEDTLGLQKYYDDHQDEFQSDVMVDVKEFRTSDGQIIEQVQKLLAEGKTEAQIDSIINDESALNLRITSQSYEKGKQDLDDAIFDKEVGYQSNILQQEDLYRIVIIEKKYPAGIKPFDKAKSECITKYQDYLEQEWLSELSESYPVEIDEDVFSKLFK